MPEDGDTYEVFSTNTDELWHIGVGYPLHFSFQRHMAAMLLFVSVLYCLPIIVQSILIFYDTLDIQGSERKNTGILIYGSYFSVYKLRLTYGFDFGVWANNNYWYIQACTIVALFIFASFTIRDLRNKFFELKQKNAMRLVQENALMMSDIPEIAQNEFERYLKKRWKDLRIEPFLYVNYVYDVAQMKLKMDRIIQLSIYRLDILRWRDSLKKYGLENEYFASSGFSPTILPFHLSHFQQLAHPYPKLDDPGSLTDKQLNLLQVNSLLKQKQNELSKLIAKRAKFTGKAFVVFRSKEDADTAFKHEKFIFRKCWRATKSICNPMDKITAVRADDPNDVIWENTSYSNCWRFGRRILTVIIAFVFIMVSMFSLVYINAVKNNAQSGIYVLKEAGKLVKPDKFYRI